MENPINLLSLLIFVLSVAIAAAMLEEDKVAEAQATSSTSETTVVASVDTPADQPAISIAAVLRDF